MGEFDPEEQRVMGEFEPILRRIHDISPAALDCYNAEVSVRDKHDIRVRTANEELTVGGEGHGGEAPDGEAVLAAGYTTEVLEAAEHALDGVMVRRTITPRDQTPKAVRF